MFKYRALLVDESCKQERPVQAHFNFYTQTADWAEKVLANAGNEAYVEIYTAIEKKSGVIKRSDLPLKPLGSAITAAREP